MGRFACLVSFCTFVGCWFVVFGIVQLSCVCLFGVVAFTFWLVVLFIALVCFACLRCGGALFGFVGCYCVWVASLVAYWWFVLGYGC